MKYSEKKAIIKFAIQHLNCALYVNEPDFEADDMWNGVNDEGNEVHILSQTDCQGNIYGSLTEDIESADYLIINTEMDDSIYAMLNEAFGDNWPDTYANVRGWYI